MNSNRGRVRMPSPYHFSKFLNRYIIDPMAAEEPVFISASDLRSTLTYQTLIRHFHQSLPSLTPDTFTSPHRQSHTLDTNSPTSSSSSLLLMPAWSASPSLPYIGVMLVTHFPLNSNSPGVHASYVLFSCLNGRTLAVIDGTELTHWRTASVSALGSELLSRSSSETLLMVGAGFLAPHLIKAHLTVRPGLKKVIVWNRTEKKARELVDKFNSIGYKGVVFESSECLEDVVGIADIVSCATNSNVALVKGEKLKEGAHLDLVGSFTPGMAECDDEAVRRGRVFVDNEAALVEAGELVGAFGRGVISRDDIAGSLVQVINGERVGRTSNEEITVFKSVGSAAVDVLCAQLVYEDFLKKVKKSK